jgi:hypothetical protein
MMCELTGAVEGGDGDNQSTLWRVGSHTEASGDGIQEHGGDDFRGDGQTRYSLHE